MHIKKNKVNFSLNTGKLWNPFIINISFLLMIFTGGIFIGISYRNTKLLQNEILTKAKSYFNHIVLTRKWNASYEGVFVEKKEGVKSNPYLIDPDITADDGRVYTKRNPSLMTKEISKLAESEGLFKFHITSLNPLNPDNKPDSFEKSSLEQFEKGLKEISETKKNNKIYYYRYMAPLITEKSCLTCHAVQGYKEGDIRGGISVGFDVTNVKKEIKLYIITLIIAGVLSFTTLFFIIFIMIRGLIKKLEKAGRTIKEMAITDELTKLYNRHYFFTRFEAEFERSIRYNKNLSVLMIDIDDFKKINDTHGHLNGDIILQATAAIIKNYCRASDIAARYGGEEFIILLPETGVPGAKITAEKIKKSIESNKIKSKEDRILNLTVCIGISGLSGKELKSIQNNNSKIINNADKALYFAKSKGKNRIEKYDE